ncbi:hypothetical protein [Zobellella sp. An-6]|uniref:hypothetical protein n=1 Tax=Zobellella sp. An-6 TaxID=3400218 RepID=UPI004040FB01
MPFEAAWQQLLARRRERVTLLVLLSSLPLVFVAGFIWPVEALSSWLDTLARLVPSTQGIKGMLRLKPYLPPGQPCAGPLDGCRFWLGPCQ